MGTDISEPVVAETPTIRFWIVELFARSKSTRLSWSWLRVVSNCEKRWYRLPPDWRPLLITATLGFWGSSVIVVVVLFGVSATMPAGTICP